MTTWQGKNVLVTGAASGIGLEVSTRLSGLGAKVIRLDRTAPDNAEDTFVTVDVTDGPATRDAITGALAPLDRLDALINCAGIGAVGGIGDNDDDEWKHVLDVNVIGTVRVSRAALPALTKSPSAAIVNVSSIAAWAGLPQRALYSASKGAVQALTLASAADLVGRVRVNCVCPGTVDTPWVGRLLDRSADAQEERRRLEARQPMGRLATAGEVAATIIWLASEEASFITGTALAVDGGMAGLRLPPRN
ncbi:SDR family NAD(P)-dependent oxidoreductase [Arthrobacter sp. B2a2-09]|uniref:SDR family NAD(P)-dependent oxidoreductase n=1 Tax=Arthrobacter sp. B2a2-09 TaxID=2952822 RepID=UPI0022CD44AF|nr:SDR family oxidoreductase [Arthrobacter sp. B2a2-09]MCZ9880962.1 SDR family oxidoreductase [Arthrobacter sp. B2a2-09]